MALFGFLGGHKPEMDKQQKERLSKWFVEYYCQNCKIEIIFGYVPGHLGIEKIKGKKVFYAGCVVSDKIYCENCKKLTKVVTKSRKPLPEEVRKLEKKKEL